MLCTLAILVSTGLLMAHGDMTHVQGTVSSIQGVHVMVKTQDGKTEMVMLGKTTKYLMGKTVGTVKDLKVGLRVVIDAKMDEKMKMLAAEEVRIGVADPKAAAPAGNTDHANH
jgi:hypothetical protein